MKPKDTTAIRKRTQIAIANRTMFLWVAGASVIFGFALVAAIFLTQMLFFNERVLHEKGLTVSILKSDYANIKPLEAQIRVLDTNQALIDSKGDTTDNAVQVILDALPSEANSLALGSSLQKKLLEKVDGLSIESISVNPVVGIETLENSSTMSVVSDVASTQNFISFNIAVSGTKDSIKQMLVNLERSIRTIDVVSMTIENQSTVGDDGQISDHILVKVQGQAFYEPIRTVELKDKTVK